jgi:hypothetical protein
MLQVLGILSWVLGAFHVTPTNTFLKWEFANLLFHESPTIVYVKIMKMVWDSMYWEHELNKTTYKQKINVIINLHEFEMIHYEKMGWFVTSVAIRFLSYNDHLQLVAIQRILQVWVLLDMLHELQRMQLTVCENIYISKLCNIVTTM